MYQNILASLIVNCSRVYKARATAYLTYFHLSRTSVVCILQDMVTPFPNVSIVSVKILLFPDAYFIFVIVNLSVWFVFWCFFLSFSFSFFQHLHLSFVVFTRFRRRRARVQIAVATLSGNSLRQTVHTHCSSVHQAAKLVAALLRVAGVIAGLAEVMAAYRRVYDPHHLQADWQEPGSAPEPYAR